MDSRRALLRRSQPRVGGMPVGEDSGFQPAVSKKTDAIRATPYRAGSAVVTSATREPIHGFNEAIQATRIRFASAGNHRRSAFVYQQCRAGTKTRISEGRRY